MSKAEQVQKLNSFIEKLAQLGEDKDELWFWQEYFEILEDDGRQKLLSNFEQEIKDLERLKK